MSENAWDEAPIIRIVNTILMYAIRDGADRIRIEPGETAVEVFYRVGGQEKPQMKLPQHIPPPVVARFKAMADIDIAQRSIAQNGRIRLKMSEKFYDVRVSTEPAEFGERVEMLIARGEPWADEMVNPSPGPHPDDMVEE